jgi:hypothetical protein
MYIRNHKPALVVLIETHRTATQVNKGGLNFPEYSTVEWPSPRIEGRGGGVALLVAQHGAWASRLPSGVLPQLTENEMARLKDTSTQLEGVEVRLKGLARPLVLLMAYIPPGTHSKAAPMLERRLQSVLDWASRSHPAPQLLLCGDFNLHHPDLGGVRADCPRAEQALFEMVCDLGFTCANTAPASYGRATHRAGGVLDLVWEAQAADSAPLLWGLEVDDGPSRMLSLSDHYAVRATLALDQPEPPAEDLRHTWGDA